MNQFPILVTVFTILEPLDAVHGIPFLALFFHSKRSVWALYLVDSSLPIKGFHKSDLCHDMIELTLHLKPQRIASTLFIEVPLRR